MKSIATTLALVSFAALVSVAHADPVFPGQPRDIVTCIDDETTFVARETMLPLYVQGLLSQGDESLSLGCQIHQAGEPFAAGVRLPDGASVLMTCKETRGGEGRLGVVVWRAGFFAETSATVTREQISPLKPQILAQLSCQ